MKRAVILGISFLCVLIGTLLAGTPFAYAQAGAVIEWGASDPYTPHQMAGLAGIVQISGINQCLALKADGTVWIWGDGKPNATQVPGIDSVIQVAAGGGHSLALKSDGTVWAWGNNGVGQLGDGTTIYRPTPIQVTDVYDASGFLQGITQIAAGGNHSLFLKSDGTVWGWGLNDLGQLGDGTRTSKNFIVQVSGLTGVTQIVGGWDYSLALKPDGTARAWGNNSEGELGNDNNGVSTTPVQVSGLTNLVQVAAGGYHSLALKSDGTVWNWGRGVMGDGQKLRNARLPVQVLGLTSITQISSGSVHSLALKSDGTVWAWGKNGYGECGKVGDGSDILTPVVVENLDPQALITAIGSGNGPGVSYSAYPVPQSGNPHSTKISLYSQVMHYGKPVTIAPKLLALDKGLPILHEALTYSIDGIVLGSAMTDTRGVVSFTLPSDIAVGKHTLSVNFVGDSPFYTAANKTTTLSVTKTDTFLKMDSVTKRYGQTAVFNVVIRRTTDSGRLSGKTISLTLDGDSIGQAATNSNGVASFSYFVDEQLQAGVHDIEASFAGDESYKTSSIDVFLSIDPADTRLTLGSIIGAYGQSKILTATLKRNTDGKPVSGRAINLSIDGNSIGTVTTDANGQVATSYLFEEPLTAGTHSVTATFTGDDGYNASTKTASLTANQASTKVTQVSVSGKVGATVQLTAKLKRTTDSKYLNARTIHFSVNGNEVGTSQTDSTGTAIYSYTIPSSLAKGKYTLKVSFNGDAFYLSSSDSSATLTVK